MTTRNRLPKTSHLFTRLAGQRRVRWLAPATWVAWMAGLSAFFLAVTVPNLANFRPVNDDEVWLMSISYKLAKRGVLGTDMWAGFYHADQHWFISLPVQHFLQAASFGLFGAGVVQARGVSLAAGLVILWVAGWLAYRWYGLGTSLLCSLLLVAWRSELADSYPGIPLLGVARVGRYDVIALAFVWISVALLDWTLRRPGRTSALALGVCSGLAALTQFIGAFIFPFLAVSWLWLMRGHAWSGRILRWMAAGAALVLLPYAAYFARYWNDAIGQQTLSAGRLDFFSPGFYVTNLLREPGRFLHLVQWPSPVLAGPEALDRPASPWLLVIVVWPALIYVWRRGVCGGRIGDRLLWLSLVTFAGMLALLEQTKAPLYGILLLPSVCMAVAALWTGALRWVSSEGGRVPIRLAGAGLLVALLAVIVLEGERAYRVDLAQSAVASHYLDVGRRIEAPMTPGAHVLGPERWWWALHDHPYLSIGSLLLQWQAAEKRSHHVPQFDAWVQRDRTDFVIVTVNVRSDLLGSPDALQRQFRTFLATCTTRVVNWTDRNYGWIEVYRVTKTVLGVPVCEARRGGKGTG
jgi:hypothetical protein